MADVDPIRVMVVSASLGKGGTERVFSLLLERFDRRVFAPELCVFDLPVSYPVPDDVPVHVLSQRPSPASVIQVPLPPEIAVSQADAIRRVGEAAARLSELVRERRPDVVLASPLWASVMALVAAARFPDSTHLINIAGAPPSAWLADDPQRELFDHLIRERLPASDRIVAVSGGVARDLVENFGIDATEIQVIHTPSNIEGVRALAREPLEDPVFDDGVPVVLSVGRLERVKGVEYLLRAVADIVPQESCRCVLVGAGTQEGYLRALAKHLGITEHVSFAGPQGNPFKYMSRATVFVLPSLSEGMPNVLLEAMACGCPVVATDIEGGVTREVLEDGACGLIVPRADPDALAQAITGLLRDPGSRALLTEQGLRRSLDFDLPKIVAQFEEMIVEVAGGPGRGALRLRESAQVAVTDRAPESAVASTAGGADHARAGLAAPIGRIRAAGGSALARLRARLGPTRAGHRALAVAAKVPGQTRLLVLATRASDLKPGASTEVLVRHLGRRSYDLHVATLFDDTADAGDSRGSRQVHLGEYGPRVRIDAARIVGPETQGHEGDLQWLAVVAGKAAHLANALQADAILADGYEAGRVALIAKRWHAVDMPVMVRIATGPSGIGSGPQGDLDAALLRDYFGLADAVFVADEEAASEMGHAFGALQGRIVRLPDAIDVESAMARSGVDAPDGPNAAGGTPRFVCSVQAAPAPDLSALLPALGTALKQERFSVTVVGCSDVVRDLEDQASAFGIDAAALDLHPGPEWSDRVLNGAVALLHVTAEPEERVPDPIVRALALGVPVIVTRGSKAVDALLEDPGPGLLVRAGDPAGLSEAMLRLLWDSEARAEIGGRGLDRLARFDGDAAALLVDETIAAVMRRVR